MKKEKSIFNIHQRNRIIRGHKGIETFLWVAIVMYSLAQTGSMNPWNDMYVISDLFIYIKLHNNCKKKTNAQQ